MGIKDRLVKAGLITGVEGEEPDSSSGSAIPIRATSGRVGEGASAESAAVDMEYVNKLREILNNARIHGIKELLDQMRVFESVPGMDEPTRMRAAFASLGSTSSIKKTDVVKAAQARMDLLSQQREVFSRQVDERKSAEIGVKTTERQQAVSEVDKLRRQITELEGRVSTLDADIQAENNRLARALASFNAAYAVVETEERALAQKLNQFLN